MAKPKYKVKPWSLNDARRLIKKLEKSCAEIGWHVGLHGSVLMRGRSSKDLDLIFYPHTMIRRRQIRYPLEMLHEVLEEQGLELIFTHQELLEYHKNNGENRTDEKWIEVWKLGERRVDVFVMR